MTSPHAHGVTAKSAPENMLFIDMMSPHGHVRLNSFYLAHLSKSKPRLCTSSDLGPYYPTAEIIPFNRPLRYTPLKRLFLAMHVLRCVHREAPTKVILLSYDLLTFPFISWALRALGVQLYCFEHNTAPITRARRWFHKISNPKVSHFVYTPYLESLYLISRISAKYVPHPCLRPDKNKNEHTEWEELITSRGSNFEMVGLCPSGSVSLNKVEEVAQANPDKLFVCKNSQQSALQNVVTYNHLHEYGAALELCDFVAVFFTIDHKVSGPVFEAIAMGKPTMVIENTFGLYIKALFPSQVFFPNEPPPKAAPPPCLNEYNESIIEKIVSELERPDST